MDKPIYNFKFLFNSRKNSEMFEYVFKNKENFFDLIIFLIT